MSQTKNSPEPNLFSRAAARPVADQFLDASQPFVFDGVPETESRILDAARRIMIEVGGDRMTMSDVARRSGFSRPTVYNYFPRASMLLDAVIESGTIAHDNEVRRSMARYNCVSDQLVAAVRTTRHWLFGILDTSFLASGYEGVLRADTAYTTRTMIRMRATMLPLVEVAKKRGEIRSDIDSEWAAEWLVRVYRSLTMEPRNLVDIDDDDDLRRFLGTFVLSGLR